jgi:hypothetical protein
MVWMVTRLNVWERGFAEPLAQRLTVAKSSMGVTLYWPVEAGFIIQAGARRLIIDPYLSDTLAEKCRGMANPDERMERPPVGPAELGRVDLVLVTHHHTHHMDPGTLAQLASCTPTCACGSARKSSRRAQAHWRDERPSHPRGRGAN